jgi:hypothetical protein
MNNHISKQSSVNPNCWLSLTTIPVILTLNAMESLGHSLIDLGLASEEIFRGSRLPIIYFPDTEEVKK